MSLTHTETEIKKSNKIYETPPFGIHFKDERTLKENPEHDVIKEKPYKIEIVWPSVIVFLLMHFGALYAVYLDFFEAKFLTAIYGVFMVYFTGFSITMGSHRLYSHRCFKANKTVQLILMILHTMTGQRTLLTWVRDHRTHHKYSDTDADPHNSSRGFFFSHIGWLLVRRHPEVLEKGKTIDMSDMKQDPIVMFQKNHYLKIFFALGIVLPTYIPYLLWNETLWNSFFIGVVFRLVGCWNLTWLINSATHLYGNRPYAKDIAPRENIIVSILVLGEGTHNYHHTFPWDYRGGENSNIATWVIDFCMKKGWAHDAKSVSRDLVRRQTMKKGDGTHPVYTDLNPNGVPVSEKY